MLAIRLFIVLLVLATISNAFKLKNQQLNDVLNQLEVPDLESLENHSVAQNTESSAMRPASFNNELGFKVASVFRDAAIQLDYAKDLKNIGVLAKEISQEIQDHLTQQEKKVSN